jgi:redox-sensitive bicupin YhaK (pirin superfamily)
MAAYDVIELEIEGRKRSLGGGVVVDRILPAARRKMVGPFIFVDRFGPVTVPAGMGVDVRPHPHIGIATVTVLFDGELEHRDSLGSVQRIGPGAVNWMTAGRGIVHSERAPAALRAKEWRSFGLQTWVALPDASEEGEPAFSHHPADTLPTVEEQGMALRLLAGAAYGLATQVPVHSPLFYAEVNLAPGARVQLPRDHEERAVYVLEGAVAVGGTTLTRNRMAVARPRTDVVVEATEPTHLVLLGGAPVGPRVIWWNFVATSADRIVDAAERWKTRGFPAIPGDDVEFIPLPDDLPLPKER